MRLLKRSECQVLHLVLKERWFDMIERGEKKEEYRDETDYWDKRISWWWCHDDIPRVVEFRRGYARDARRMAFVAENCRTTCDVTHEEWGEWPGWHFLITLGERVAWEGDGQGQKGQKGRKG